MAVNGENTGDGLQAAGDVNVEELILISSSGQEFDIRQYLIEINIFEDMFRGALYGNMLVVDAGNLAATVPMINDEYLRVKFTTPTINSSIYKTFRVYSTTDRRIISDTNKQTYILHFCSPELFIDMLSPVYGTFKGKVSEVVSTIFAERLSTSRNGQDGDDTQLVILGPTDNEIKFTSPGWTPIQCMHWLATRAIGQGYKNPGYLFFESNKAFYFANVEAMIDVSIQSKEILSEYVYVPNNLTGQPEQESYSKSVVDEFKKVENMEVVETFNGLKNAQGGYYANRLYTVDIFNKKYEIYDYDHVASYSEYKHMENIGGTPNEQCQPFLSNTLRGPASLNVFYPVYKGQYSDFSNNVSEKIQDIIPRRISTMQELTNFKLVITVPGRTDAEIGSMIYFAYPDSSPRDSSDKAKDREDPLYSGYYMITAIRHKVTLQKHMMIMELVKDSYKKREGTANQ
jgi:hypothetical protein